jgi:glycosyltransferase involved in cell wall biosynthesis
MIIGGAQENTLLTCEDLLRAHGDDVLLITGPPLGPEGSMLDRARANGVPLVVHTVHGAPFHPYQGRGARAFFRGCERWAARRCHAFISVADAMTDLMVAARVAPRERFTTIYSGMEVEPFLSADQHRGRVRAELGYTDRDIVVGKIARLFHLKGHDDLIKAASQVARSNPDVRYLLVGDGILRQRLERRIAAAGLTDRFRFLGLTPPERIPELMAAMDMVAHVSLREGLARVLPQGLIAGRPVISYDIDGAREVVLPRLTGCLLPPGDVPGLAAAIMELAGDAALRARLGAEGRRRFTQVFRHEHMAERIRALYVAHLSRH